LKLFGANIRSNDVTNKVQDILRSNVRQWIRNQVLNRMKDLVGKDPIYSIPLEIGELKDTRSSDGLGIFSLVSRSA
jgi:hypothetical protein